MSKRFLKTAALMVLATASAFALANDTPARVGRISLAQGQVGISGELGDETEPALVNWPVTSNNQLTTGRNSRTEVRIGSTSLRLDEDTSIDVNELDDDSLRITLHYGNLSIRVRNPEVLRGLELDTPQGVVRLQDIGRVRIESGRREDTTAVSVFDGEATFDGAGARLIVRTGKRVEIVRDDVRTGLAMRDSFDEWGMMRDARDERSESVRYVTSEMTGYEDLDQYGAWRQDAEYGPVWYPRAVSTGWVPYRDGRWTYLQPWGWTWVDNAPWGYAPFHYGRWVQVDNRWCWSPGRNITRAVWSPALVGWVGGSNWNVSFSSGGGRRPAPATGWYPLSPRDTYVPTYRVNHDNLRYLNRNAGDVRDDIRGRNRPDNRERAGLTVVPHDQFQQRGTVVVPKAPGFIMSTVQLVTAPTVTPPAPNVVRQHDNRGGIGRGPDRNGDGRPDNYGNRGNDRPQPQFGNQASPRPSPIVSQPGQPQGSAQGNGGRPVRVLTLPSQPQQPQTTIQAPRRFIDGPDPLRRENTSSMPTPAPALPPQMQTPPQQPQQQPQQREERGNRGEQNDPERERRSRGAESWQQQQQQQQRVYQPQPQPQQQAPQPQQQRAFQPPQPQPQQQPQQRSAPPSMPPPQMQQPAPRPAPPAQPEKVDKPAQGRAMGSDESRRRAREDSDRR